MLEAERLLKLYKEKKEAKPVSLAEEFAPIFANILTALGQIASKEIPAPLVTIEQPDVQVSVEAPKIVNDVQLPEASVPVVNVENYDYTSILIELKRAVDKLTEVVENRPKTWEVERNSRGFIQKVNGI